MLRDVNDDVNADADIAAEEACMRLRSCVQFLNLTRKVHLPLIIQLTSSEAFA